MPRTRSKRLAVPKPSPNVRPVRASSLKVLLIAWMLLGLLGSVWCFASPLMSAPDEPAHTVKAAAVARGQFTGIASGVQGERLAVQVPAYLAKLEGNLCFAHKPDVTADCSPPIDATDRGAATALTSAGNYNPVYYGIVGVASRGLSGEPALYAMRLVSTWLCTFFLATVFWAATSLRRFVWPSFAAAVALTPAVFFLSASINPTALEIATAASVFMCLCALMERSRALQHSQALIWCLAVAGALLANTRPVSLLWLAVVVAASILAYNVKAFARLVGYRPSWTPMALLGAACIFALGWIVSSNSFDSLLPGTPVPSDVATVTMLDHTFIYVPEYVGVLGWLDTPPPPAVLYTWVLAMGVVLMVGMTARPVRARWSVALLAAAVLVAPVSLQAASSEKVGWIWQGRYILAMLVVLLLACGVASRLLPFRRTERTLSLVRWSCVTGGIAHVYLLLEGLRRYTVGTGEGHVNWTEMFHPNWQPPFTWQGLTIVYIVVLGISGFCFYRLITTPQAAVGEVVGKQGIVGPAAEQIRAEA